MKQSILILFLMGICTYTQAQSKSVEALYNKYSSEKDFFHLDLAGSLLGFADGLDFKLDEAGMGALTKSLERVKMFKLPVQGELAHADFQDASKRARKGKV